MDFLRRGDQTHMGRAGYNEQAVANSAVDETELEMYSTYEKRNPNTLPIQLVTTD
jgi:hypothetical protein